MKTPIEQAARDVLRDCPQDEPQVIHYETIEEWAVARERWRIANILRPALVMTRGSPS